MPSPIYVDEDRVSKTIYYGVNTFDSAQGTYDTLILPTPVSILTADPLYVIPPSGNPAKYFEIEFKITLCFVMFYVSLGAYNIYEGRTIKVSSVLNSTWSIDGYPMPQEWLGSTYNFKRTAQYVRSINIPSISALAAFGDGIFIASPVSAMNIYYSSATNFMRGYLSCKIKMIK